MKTYFCVNLLWVFGVFISSRVLLVQGESHTYFASKSFQNKLVMNGTGEPISEKRMSSFKVEDHKGDNE